MSSVADAFANICNYLRGEEAALRGLGASDLKACLRTGAGTKGHSADSERYKHYRLLNKIEKDLTIEQRQEILEWEAKLCGNQHMEQSDATSFAKLTDILQRRKTDLQELRKSSLEACFLTNKSNTDKDLQFGRNFCKFLVPWEQMECPRPILQLRMQSDANRCYIAVIQLPRRVSPAAGCRASFCWRSPPCRWTQPCQVVEFNYQFMPDGT